MAENSVEQDPDGDMNQFLSGIFDFRGNYKCGECGEEKKEKKTANGKTVPIPHHLDSGKLDFRGNYKCGECGEKRQSKRLPAGRPFPSQIVARR
jgi:DNA-directed RNA polymerase subunit RPC12/RpoP